MKMSLFSTGVPRALCCLVLCLGEFAGAQAPASAPPSPSSTPTPLTLDDLLAEPDLVDAALSPSGNHLALVLRRQDSDVVALMDLRTRATSGLTNIGRQVAGDKLEVRVTSVHWKSDERLLFRTRTLPREDARFGRSSEKTFLKLGDRLFAINRDGSNLRRLLGDNAEGALDGALNLGRIASTLPRDADHVLLIVNGFAGPSLFRTNIHTGVGTMVEKPRARIMGWWLDLDGKPVLREEYLNGSIRILRLEADGSWKKVLSYRPNRRDEHPEYQEVGHSDQPGKFYVLARPPGKDRRGIYLYDIATETFGEAVAEHPQYDLVSARISRDGKRVVSYCHVAHVRVCEFADRKIQAHVKGLRRFFRDSANVRVADASDDEKTILLFVDGPSEAPGYYYYRVDQARIEPVGMQRDRLVNRAMPTAEVVRWQARDGLELTGYLTRPPGGAKAARMPLVVLPHGGPKIRDQLEFNVWTQFIASLGYAVFQPNFRGSDGFGLAFLEQGHGEWGGKMQHDITDGLDALIASGSVDPERVCIVGASYGGYAALAGVTLTPDKYRCAVSVAGISDLPSLLDWLRRDVSTDSDAWRDVTAMIGDPARDAVRLAATSPARLAAAVKAPVLLIHGEDDGITPITQSERMKKALEKEGRKVELIRLAETAHSWWPLKTERKVLTGIEAFLRAHLGPGIPSQP
jgi:dienelactone hydrolase